MRWLPVLILSYLVIVLQTSVGRVLTLQVPVVGVISPDLAAVVAVFLALRAPSATDAMLLCWVLGLLVDLTAGGGLGAGTVVGPMPLAYALAGGAVSRMREALFLEHALTQFLLVLLFCAFTHTAWITTQAVVNWREVSWSGYFGMLGRMAVSAFYAAVLAPLVHYVLIPRTRWFVTAPVSRSGRIRRRRGR